MTEEEFNSEATFAIQKKLSRVGNGMLVSAGAVASLVLMYLSMYFIAVGIFTLTLAIAVYAIYNSLKEPEAPVVDFDIIDQIYDLDRSVSNYINSGLLPEDRKQLLIEMQPDIDKLYSFANVDDEIGYKMFSDCYENALHLVKDIVDVK